MHTRMSVAACWQAQNVLRRHPSDLGSAACVSGLSFDGDESPSVEVFPADEATAREAGLRACGHLVDLVLNCDARIANHLRIQE